VSILSGPDVLQYRQAQTGSRWKGRQGIDEGIGVNDRVGMPRYGDFEEKTALIVRCEWLKASSCRAGISVSLTVSMLPDAAETSSPQDSSHWIDNRVGVRDLSHPLLNQ